MLKNIFDKILGRKKHEFKRHDLINMLIDHFLYKRYLEIGVDKSANFTSIRCESKTSVDPAEGLYAHAKPTYQITSDEFFRNVAPTLEKFDIIFIDGLHHHKQVNRDIENSLKYLNENGSIVLHDCNPAKEIHQSVPRKSTLWNGDVWKSIVEFRNTNKELGCLVIDTDYGLG
ncbi:MAG: class I SAM-dependent methyltransferase [Bacteroidota bacterium]